MKNIIFPCFFLIPFIGTAQTFYSAINYDPTVLECVDEYITTPNGNEYSFTGLLIKQGHYLTYLNYPYTAKVGANNTLIFTDLDKYGDKITVGLSETTYGNMVDFMAAAVACMPSYSGGGGGTGGFIDSLGYYSDTLRIYEDGNGTYPQMVEIVAGTGPGGASIVEVTYAEMDSLISNSLLTEGQFYNITDAAGTDLGFITQAVKDNEITVTGTGGYLNADFQAVGDYSGVEAITGVAAGTQLGIWTVGKDSTLTTGDIVIWNLKHYQCLHDTLTNGADPVTNTAGYQELLKTDTNQGYIEEWDESEFDFANEWLQKRADDLGNIYFYSKGQDDLYFSLGYPTLLDFQWGRDDWYGNKIDGGWIYEVNSLCSFSGNIVKGWASCTNNTWKTSNAILSDNTLESQSGINNIVSGDNCYIYNNYLYTDAYLTNIEIIGDSLSDSEIGNNILFFDAVIDGNALALLPGGLINYNKIGSGITIAFSDTTSGFSNKIVEDGFSNLSDTIDISGLTTLDLTGYDYVGIFYLTSTNATETISNITNAPTQFPFSLYPVPGLTLTISGVNVTSAVAGDIVLASGTTGTTELEGNKGEYMEFEFDALGTGYLVEKHLIFSSGSGVGTASIVDITYADMSTAITNATLTEGQFYNITDASGTDLGFITQAVKDNEITVTGTGGYLNADFQAAGDYSGVAAITGVAAGTQQGIWTADKDSTLTTGDIVIWNLKHWQCLEDTLTDGTDPATNTAAYQELLKTDTNQGYIEEWDASEFDFENELIEYRKDLRGNVVYGNAGVSIFQWGNDLCYDNYLLNGYVDAPNLLAQFSTNTLYQGAYLSGVNVGENSVIELNTLGVGSIIEDITTGDNLVISYNYLGVNCTLTSISAANVENIEITSNVLDVDANITIITASSEFTIASNSLSAGSTIGDFIMNYRSSVSNNSLVTAVIATVVIGERATIINNYLNPGSSIANIVIDSSSEVALNYLSPDAAIDFTDTLSILASVKSNEIGSGFTVLIDSLGFSNKKVGVGFSNFSDTIDVTNLDTLDLTGYGYVGIFYLTSTNATDTLSQITNFPTAFPFTLRPVPGLAVTFTATSISSAVAGDIVLPAASFTADGSKQDWIEFEQDSGGVGFVKYKNGVNNY